MTVLTRLNKIEDNQREIIRLLQGLRSGVGAGTSFEDMEEPLEEPINNEEAFKKMDDRLLKEKVYKQSMVSYDFLS